MATVLGDPEALVAEVTRRAHHRALELSEDAKRRAAAILQGANEEMESFRRESAEDAERQVTALVRREAARAEHEAKRRFILLREKPIDRVWRAAEEKLREIVRQPGYLDILRRCALHAARELGATEAILAADPLGHALLGPEVLAEWSKEAGIQFHRASEPAETWGGLIASSGRSRFDATFQTSLAAAHENLRERVFAALTKGAS